MLGLGRRTAPRNSRIKCFVSSFPVLAQGRKHGITTSIGSLIQCPGNRSVGSKVGLPLSLLAVGRHPANLKVPACSIRNRSPKTRVGAGPGLMTEAPLQS